MIASDLRLGQGLSEEAAAAGAKFLRYLMSEDNIARVTVESGLLPARLDYYSSPIILDDPVVAKITAAASLVIDNSVPWLQGTVYVEAMGGVNSVIYGALDQGMHAAQALHNMEQAINSRLAAYYGN
ncbi:MAG: hypothetical protein GX161_06375 [Firmicutes bacterium]|nr:hypothetical protein [Bacillota bacterium]